VLIAGVFGAAPLWAQPGEGDHAWPTTRKTANSPPPRSGPLPTVRYVDRPDCLETFADSITGVTFGGQTLRLEFCETRMDDMKPITPASGGRYPAWCR